MPGFQVSGGLSRSVGEGVSLNHSPFYQHTWNIPFFGGENIGKEDARAFCRDATLPTFSVEKEEVQGPSLTYKYASNVNWDDVRITFYDIPVSNDIAKNLCGKLKNWRRQVWNEEHGIGMASIDHSSDGGGITRPTAGYKQNTNIHYFSGDTDKHVTWQLFGSWPQTIRDGDLTYTTSEIKLVEVVLSYDWAECDASNDTLDW